MAMRTVAKTAMMMREACNENQRHQTNQCVFHEFHHRAFRQALRKHDFLKVPHARFSRNPEDSGSFTGRPGKAGDMTTRAASGVNTSSRSSRHVTSITLTMDSCSLTSQFMCNCLKTQQVMGTKSAFESHGIGFSFLGVMVLVGPRQSSQLRRGLWAKVRPSTGLFTGQGVRPTLIPLP
ncbi:Uncharacterized protein Fot_51444 [Forsythia ovata]|uniref:Uncharacterized protein n=1 Tax=Forsythia ovata TaxID=205694 RepID=A0ABD1PYB9_9LAMI